MPLGPPIASTPGMILLVTHCVRALELAAAIQQSVAELTEQAESLPEAVRRVRDRDYSAIVVDQFLAENDPEGADELALAVGHATLVTVNLAISGIERVVRELRAALRRREAEIESARQAAEKLIRSELTGPLTAMLLSCQMALTLPELPPVVQRRFAALQELAKELCDRLEVAA